MKLSYTPASMYAAFILMLIVIAIFAAADWDLRNYAAIINTLSFKIFGYGSWEDLQLQAINCNAFLPQKFWNVSIQGYIVDTRSMLPELQYKDVTCYVPIEKYEIGDILSYSNKQSYIATSHRLVGIYNDYLVMQGDNVKYPENIRYSQATSKLAVRLRFDGKSYTAKYYQIYELQHQ